jgi:hypothetical protein
VLTFVFSIIAAAGVFAGLYYLGVAASRNGDRPGDALVTALVTTGAHPEGARPLVVATVANPSGIPVLAALTTRRDRMPALLADPHVVGVPRLTLRRKFRPDRYESVGVVPAGGTAELTVPAPVPARRYVLTVAVGQEGARLRVHRLRIAAVSRAAEGRGKLFSPIPHP